MQIYKKNFFARWLVLFSRPLFQQHRIERRILALVRAYYEQGKLTGSQMNEYLHLQAKYPYLVDMQIRYVETFFPVAGKEVVVCNS